MREIKFRAWDKTGKRMGEVNYIRYSNVQYNQVSARFKQNEKTVDEWFNYGDKDGCDNIILMQYAGLKDRKGKDIFEGDIVAEGTINYVVAFYAGAWRLKQNIDGDTWRKSLYRYVIDRKLKVIGNIYENPEFLKEDK